MMPNRGSNSHSGRRGRAAGGYSHYGSSGSSGSSRMLAQRPILASVGAGRPGRAGDRTRHWLENIKFDWPGTGSRRLLQLPGLSYLAQRERWRVTAERTWFLAGRCGAGLPVLDVEVEPQVVVQLLACEVDPSLRGRPPGQAGTSFSLPARRRRRALESLSVRRSSAHITLLGASRPASDRQSLPPISAALRAPTGAPGVTYR
jgi:hypothetical protein